MADKNPLNNLDVVGVKQAAELIGYSDRSIRDFLNKGKLKGSKLHKTGKWLIPRSEIDRFLVEQPENKRTEAEEKISFAEGVDQDAKAYSKGQWQTDITHVKDIEEHWQNIEFLIEKWQEQNFEASIPSIKELIIGAKPGLPRHKHYFDFDILFLPLGVGRRIILDSLHEHLRNYTTLWQYHADRINKSMFYEELCKKFKDEIIEEGISWANVILEEEFEQPMLFLADCKLYGATLDFSEGSFKLPELHEIRWSAQQSKLIATLPERIRGMLGPKNMQLSFTILQANNPLDCIQLYEVMCSRLLNGESINNLIQINLELHDLRVKMAEIFEEILTRRDYKKVNCKYCPVQ